MEISGLGNVLVPGAHVLRRFLESVTTGRAPSPFLGALFKKIPKDEPLGLNKFQNPEI